MTRTRNEVMRSIEEVRAELARLPVDAEDSRVIVVPLDTCRALLAAHDAVPWLGAVECLGEETTGEELRARSELAGNRLNELLWEASGQSATVAALTAYFLHGALLLSVAETAGIEAAETVGAIVRELGARLSVYATPVCPPGDT